MPTPPPILTRDLGRMPYEQALELQRGLNQGLIAGTDRPTILLVEHEPVITLTRRKAVREHLLADEAELARLGVATAQTDRGGDITYHGPGQLVVYPILRLADYGLNLSSYMRLLEQAVIDTAEGFGISAHRECGATGVWVRRDGEPDAKLCAMGVRIRKNTTMHGLALNVDPDREHFKLIVPCGLHGRPVTSLKELLGEHAPGMQQVKDHLIASMKALLENGMSKCETPANRSGATGSAPGTTPGS